MGSKREEERNEKIIRGLMKLPPNRRCINCNSLGPQYVCTNFWTFVCMPCSGVHREFTHRVKSVSMAKFTLQEVDALQKGGNQRAREIFLKAWDSQTQRLPDNSNPDKVREFIKHVYVDKRYTLEKLSDKPPRDPQTIKIHEDEMRRASSYHSFSQSPPYDFQYEERRYGKPGFSLSRKPGSDRGLYEGKVSSFSSPSRHSSDHAYDERFANEGSWPRVSDYSISSGGDPFRSDVISPCSQKETWSPFSESETSNNFSSEIHGHHTSLESANSRGGNGRVMHPLRTASTGSIGSFDSMSFKSVKSTGLQEVATEAQQSNETSHEKASSFPSLPQSSKPATFNGLDLFNEPFAPQSIASNPTNVPNSQPPESFLPLPLDLFQQSSIPSASSLTEQQPLKIPQSSPLDLDFTSSLNANTSDVVIPQEGGWATFDVSQNDLNIDSENSTHAVVSSSLGNDLQDLNPFSLYQIASSQKSPSLELSSSINTLWQDNLQSAEATTNSNQVWNAFEDSTEKHPVEYKLEDRNQTPLLYDSADNTFLGSGLHEVLHNDGNFRTSNGIEPPSSSLYLHSSMPLHDFSFVPEDGVSPVATAHKPTNPFNLPCDADLELSNTAQFWDMSSLQASLPDNQATDAYTAGSNESWFPHDLMPSSYIPGAVAFDPPNGSMGYILGQVPSTQIPSGPSQGPVASIGGNPFA